MRHERKRVWLALAAAALVAGCGRTDVKRVEVGGHVFGVPEANLMPDRLPFLPASPDASLTALLNPEAPPPERLTVLVEPVAAACKPGATLSERLRRACAVAQGHAPQPVPGRLTRRPRFPDDPTQYDYLGEDGGVALSCNASEGGGGSCGMIHAWRDLVWSVDIRESEVPRAEEIRAEIMRRLDEWAQG